MSWLKTLAKAAMALVGAYILYLALLFLVGLAVVLLILGKMSSG